MGVFLMARVDRVFCMVGFDGVHVFLKVCFWSRIFHGACWWCFSRGVSHRYPTHALLLPPSNTLNPLPHIAHSISAKPDCAYTRGVVSPPSPRHLPA